MADPTSFTEFKQLRNIPEPPAPENEPGTPNSYAAFKSRQARGAQAAPEREQAGPSSYVAFKSGLNRKAPQEEEQGMFSRAFERGARGTAASFAEFGGLLGIDSLAEYGEEQRKEIQNLPAEVTFEDIENAEGAARKTALFGKFAAEKAVENIPNLLSLLAGGGVGGAAVRGGMAATRAARGAGAAAGAGTRAKRAGQIAGFAGADVALQTGESAAGLREEGVEPTLGNTLPVGTVKAALDLAPFGLIARRFGLGKKADDVLLDAGKKAGFFRQVGQDIAVVGLAESGTETTQAWLDIINKRIETDEEVFGSLTDEEKTELKEAAAAGLGVGFIFGGAGSAASRATGSVLSTEAGEPGTADRRAALQEDLEAAERQAQFLEEQLEAEGRRIGEETEAPEGIPEQTQPRVTGQDYLRFTPAPVEQGPSERKRIFGVLDGGVIYNNNQVTKPVPGVKAVFDGQTAFRINMDNAEWSQTPFNADLQSEGDISFVDSNLDIEGAPKTAKVVEDTIRSIRDTLFPGQRVIVTQPNNVRATVGGAPKRTSAGNWLSDETGRILIGMDFERIFTGKKSADQVKNDLLWKISHELGHNLAPTLYNESSPEIKRAVLGGYREWLNDAKTMNLQEFVDAYAPVGDWKLRLKPPVKGEFFRQDRLTPIEVIAEREPNFTEYHFSFAEYLAQQTARWVQHRQSAIRNASPETKQFFGDLLKKLRRLFNIFKKKAPRNTETFETFVELLAVRSEINALRQQMDLEPLSPKEVRDMQRKKARVSIKDELATEEIVDEMAGGSDPSNVHSTKIADFEEEIGWSKSQVDTAEELTHIHLRVPRLLKALTPLQIAKRFNVPKLLRYMDLVQDYSVTKMKVIGQADEIAQKMVRLPAGERDKFARFALEVNARSTEKIEKGEEEAQLSQEELQEVVEETGIGEEALAVWREMDASFRDVLDGIEIGLLIEAVRPFVPGSPTEFVRNWQQIGTKEKRGEFIAAHVESTKNQIALAQRMGEIEASINTLRNRNYFPLMRFGPYTLTMKAPRDGYRYEGRIFNEGEVVEFRTYENRKQRDADLAQVKKERPEMRLRASKADDRVADVIGMPQPIIERVRQELAGTISDEQKEILDNVALSLAPGRSFLRHLQRRRGVLGYSEDVVRVYSRYMQSAANHLARVQHAPAMIEALEDYRTQIKTSNLEDVTGHKELESYFRRHFDYIMKPENDLAGLRSLGFQWYLGFNVKSAMVNLTQVPMVTYPVLAGRFGDSVAISEITKAYKDVRRNLEQAKTLSDDEKDMMAQMREAALLDESYAMELAGLGEGAFLAQLSPANSLNRSWNKLQYYGAFMFRGAEQYNRRVSALAGYRAARRSGMSHDAAVRVARDTIQESQFEYQKWNRPEFMRGKKSVIFLFWQYMQHASYLALGQWGDKVGRQQAIRFWGTMFVLAGLVGVPFAEMLLDLLDLFGTKAKEAMGVSDPRVAIREDIRELLTNMTDSPDGIMHGLGRYYGLGPLHALSFMGVPMPNVDMSASLSLGRAIPWFEDAMQPTRDPAGTFAQTVVNISGPLGQIGYNIYRTAASPDVNNWKNLERNMPVALKNISRALGYARNGALEDSAGAKLLEFEGENPVHQAEIIAQLLGFTPTRVSQQWDFIGSQREAAMYWSIKRARLLDGFDYAQRKGSREAKAAARQAVKKFNDKVRNVNELKPLIINAESIKQSMQGRERMRHLRESGMAQDRKMELLNREIRKLYPEVE